LTKQEYFDSTVKRILQSINYIGNIEIKILDHDTLEGKHKRAIGCCHKFSDNNYMITIDEYFVQECYEHFI
jgi:hypothetical protein